MAVIDPSVQVDDAYMRRSDNDFRVEWFSGSGAGGQHRNKHANSCRVYHIPTGLVEARQGRERVTNLRDAKAAIIASLDAAMRGSVAGEIAGVRKGQVGSGQRADKTVTIRFQDDKVSHHESGKTMSATRYMKGFMDDVWA